MNPHLRVILATPTFVVGTWAMLATRKILGDEGAEIVGWGWASQDDLDDARYLAWEEHQFAMACEERYAQLEAYVLSEEPR